VVAEKNWIQKKVQGRWSAGWLAGGWLAEWLYCHSCGLSCKQRLARFSVKLKFKIGRVWQYKKSVCMCRIAGFFSVGVLGERLSIEQNYSILFINSKDLIQTKCANLYLDKEDTLVSSISRPVSICKYKCITLEEIITAINYLTIFNAHPSLTAHSCSHTAGRLIAIGFLSLLYQRMSSGGGGQNFCEWNREMHTFL
jgi:hypothetical protein